MPEIAPGINTEQFVMVVAANSVDINDAIDTMAVNGWIVGSFTPSGSDVIILFTRNVPIEAT